MISRITQILFYTYIFTFSIVASSQKVTKVVGRVVDARTNETMPFVDVGFKGTSVGVSTDYSGKFVIDTRFPSDTLFVSYLGYETQYFRIPKGKRTKLKKISLKEEGLLMDVVEIRVKKAKYVKKNNPAIDLAQKVISNRYINSLKGKDYYSYKQQEKIKIDLNNITEKIKGGSLTKKFDFIWSYIDTSDVNGKTFLPIFLRETISNIYYKKDGDVLRERRVATKATNLEAGLDKQTLNDMLDVLYQDIDIYAPKIDLLDKQFVSPFAKAGYNFYRYYIMDTTYVNGREAINLAFIPAVKGNFGFTGNIFISNDGKFTVLKVNMTIVRDINLNFVNDIKIVQEFEPMGETYIKTKDQVTIDYSISNSSFGVFGTRTLFYTDFNFEKQDDKYYGGIEKIVYEDGANEKTEEYWDDNRIKPLEKGEVNLGLMIDSLNRNKYYKAYKYFGKLVVTNYAPIGPLSFGPIVSFVTFNDVEGMNLRFGGETNQKLSPKVRLTFSGAYAKKTKKWKYATGLLYTFNKNYDENPRHYLRASAERESYYPGRELEFFDPENLFVSFHRGDATRMLFNTTYELNYTHEMNGFSYYVSARHKKREPYGSLKFLSINSNEKPISTPDITTAEVGIGIRYAPNEQFLQGKSRRRQILNEFPIFNLDFVQGLDGVLGGKYKYSKLKFNMFKQFEWTTFGTTNLMFEAGKTFGKIPYILQLIPRGNQTYTYRLKSYNMMNFLEFATDQFVSVNFEHFFQGLILNRIPLIKKLKLREVISFKGIYGSLSDENNPNLDPSAIQFPLSAEGQSTTFLFGDEPYMEASFGLTNILKVFRVDLVKRLNYLDNPNIPKLFNVKGLGVRLKVRVEF